MTILESNRATATVRLRRLGRRSSPWAYVSPALVVIGLLTVAPLLYGIYLSFTNWSLRNGDSPHLEGISAYRAVIDNPEFLGNLGRTVVWTIITLVVQVVIAFPLALLLNVRTPATGLLTGLLMIPWITPFVVLSYAWQFLYDGTLGPLHALLHGVGLVGASSPLTSPDTALWSIAFISGWKGVPFLTVALLAARKGIPDDLFEATAIDGAGRFGSFRHLTLPLMRPTLGAMLVVLGIQAFYSFDLVWILTRGGPGSSSQLLAIQLYNSFFTQGSPGQAAALGLLMLVIALALLVPILRLTARKD